MTFSIRQLDHVVVNVADMERALNFYVGVLGCSEARRPSDRLVQLRAGASLIDLMQKDKTGGPAPNMDHFAIAIEPFDEDAIRKHLEGHGVEPGKVVSRFGAEGQGPSMYIHDPDGNMVELKGPPER